ncbi:MAG: FAD-dependent oxidoreductase [Pseudomonadota bacterium]
MERGFTMDQAVAEAARCLLCHDAPCSTGCPAGTDPDVFIRKLRLRNLKGAAALIKENNPLGGVSSVVCPTCSLCQAGCTAEGLDQPIRIGQLQRFLVEWAWDTGFQPLRAGAPTGKRVAVIGAGPAGLTCAAELARAGHGVTIFEAKAEPGGMLRYGIPEHRLSREFIRREVRDVTDLGVEIRCGEAVAGDGGLDGLFGQGYAAVYVATGAWLGLALDATNRPEEGLLEALAFLGLAKDDPDAAAGMVRGRQVAVIGGGDTAMDAAVTAQLLGAADVYVLYRRSFTQMPGEAREKEQALAAGVHFMLLTQPVDYLSDGPRLTGVSAVRTRLGAPDQSGRRRPVAVPDTEHVYDVDLVIEAIGLKPAAGTGALGVATDDVGRVVITGAGGATARAGVFSGGDAVRGPSLVARAIGDGKAAAAAITATLVRGGA